MSAAELPAPSKAPCGTCPYRRDVPAGIWHADEYVKLPPYDGETWEQPHQLFFCHQADGHLCAGWVAVHDTAHLLAMRIHRVDESAFSYRSPVPLFSSGTEAALHGLDGIENPSPAALAAIRKLGARRK